MLPTCESTATGSISCSVMPRCEMGFYGSPTIEDVTCGTHGAELTVSGCTECSPVPNSVGPVVCTSATTSQVTACEPGHTLLSGTMDICSPNSCSQRTTEVPGYASLPVCESRVTGAIACSALPVCDGPEWSGAPTLADITCDYDGAELTVSGCVLAVAGKCVGNTDSATDVDCQTCLLYTSPSPRDRG